MKGVKENRIGGKLYNKVENLAGYKRDSEINPMKVVDALFTMQKKVGIFSKIHAYLFIKTRREFINLRRLLMKRRRLLEILKIRLFLRK